LAEIPARSTSSGPQTGLQENRRLPGEDPAFLKRLLVAALVFMRGQNYPLKGLEVTRMMDVDFLDRISDDFPIACRLTKDYGGAIALRAW
jgi:hypothetical protein